ncbi:MAG: TetR/AcrR family transcriptional regulator C-terminal domain-containing protein [Roseburia sp.]|nr:TetR/AcrR family transcriptional regulator C-terminal domain-containing protein [Roseburia sp.]
MKDVRKLLSEALVEICENKPLDNVTVTEITKQAKLTRQVFYRHFVDKYDLAKYIHLHDYYSALENAVLEDDKGVDMWGRVSRAWFDVIKEKAKFYQNIYRSNSGGEFKRIMRTYITNFYMGIVEQQLEKQMDPDIFFVVQLYLAGATEKINDWVASGAKIPVEELSRLLYLGMPEKIRNLVIFNELDAETAKMIARNAYPE